MRVSARAAAGGEVVPRTFGSGHEQEEASRPPGTPSAHGPILIADDEGPIVETLAFLARAAGFTPVVASHGRQALELAPANQPVLVITAAGPRSAMASGTDAVVTKPFALAKIEVLLRRFFGPLPE